LGEYGLRNVRGRGNCPTIFAKGRGITRRTGVPYHKPEEVAKAEGRGKRSVVRESMGLASYS